MEEGILCVIVIDQEDDKKASDSLSHGSVWSPSFSLMRLVTHATGLMGRILAEH